MHAVLKKIIFLICATTVILAGLHAEAQTSMTESQLDQSVSKLIDSLKVERKKSARRQVLEGFHQELATEINAMSDSGIRNSVYWKAIELDTNLIRIIEEKKCSEIKRALSYNYESLPETASMAGEAQLKTALTITELVCQ